MALRQIEIIIPKGSQYALEQIRADESVVHIWDETSAIGSDHLLKVLVDAAHTEQFLDKVEHYWVLPTISGW